MLEDEAFAKQDSESIYTCVYPIRATRSGCQVLLALREHGMYDGFGGEVEADESVEESAHGMLMEEIGVEGALQPCAEVVVLFDGGKRTRHYIFIAQFESEPEQIDSGKISPAWFETDAVPYAKMWPYLQELLPIVLRERSSELLLRGYFELADANLTKCCLLAPILHIGALPPDIESKLRISVEVAGLAFDCCFNGSKSEFDTAWKWTWAALSTPRTTRLTEGPLRSASTADTTNRIRDQHRVETNWSLPEFGHMQAEFRDKTGSIVAHGFQNMVYGDHGPYLEFTENQIWWPTFLDHKLKGPARTHFEHSNSDGSVKLYDQFKTVADQPNPPPGDFAASNNRADGYADYRAGCIYIPCDDFFSNGGTVLDVSIHRVCPLK